MLLLLACAQPADTALAVDTAELVVDADGDGFDTRSDCADDDASVFPGAPEICDGRDQDCDGEIDERAIDMPTWYDDGDEDGWGDEDSVVEACDAPDEHTDQLGDCDDTNGLVYPGADELCDELDNDCDGSTDEDVGDPWYADEDEDGYGDPDAMTLSCSTLSGHTSDDTDCDDEDPDVHRGGAELCDGVDNDCDGEFDEDDAEDADTWYRDRDSDGYGDGDSGIPSCSAPPGRITKAGDCDDRDAEVHPTATEWCDDIDNDCDGDTDESTALDRDTYYLDADGDGEGTPDATTEGCSLPVGYALDDDDCDDSDSSVFPGADETCDDRDEDCDGDVDENAIDQTTWNIDYDGDGWGSSSYTTDACTQPAGWVADDTDCDDTDASVHPHGAETCDGIDGDCDGLVDEDPVRAPVYYIDHDGDGYGSPDYLAAAREVPAGYVDNAEDCDDLDPAVLPEHGGGCPVGDSCRAIYEDGRSVGDEVYLLGVAGRSFEATCDMAAEGWTLCMAWDDVDVDDWGADGRSSARFLERSWGETVLAESGRGSFCNVLDADALRLEVLDAEGASLASSEFLLGASVFEGQAPYETDCLVADDGARLVVASWAEPVNVSVDAALDACSGSALAHTAEWLDGEGRSGLDALLAYSTAPRGARPDEVLAIAVNPWSDLPAAELAVAEEAVTLEKLGIEGVFEPDVSGRSGETPGPVFCPDRCESNLASGAWRVRIWVR